MTNKPEHLTADQIAALDDMHREADEQIKLDEIYRDEREETETAIAIMCDNAPRQYAKTRRA